MACYYLLSLYPWAAESLLAGLLVSLFKDGGEGSMWWDLWEWMEFFFPLACFGLAG